MAIYPFLGGSGSPIASFEISNGCRCSSSVLLGATFGVAIASRRGAINDLRVREVGQKKIVREKEFWGWNRGGTEVGAAYHFSETVQRVVVPQYIS